MKKKIRPKIVHVKSRKAVLTTLSEIFRSKITKYQKPFDFVPEKFLKLYLWTRRMKMWQQCWKVFARVNWISAQSPKKMKRKKIKSIFSENVDLDTQNPALKNMLFFSGKGQLVSVLRRKKTAKFILILKKPSFFKMLPLTFINHIKIPFRSNFLPQISKDFA